MIQTEVMNGQIEQAAQDYAAGKMCSALDLTPDCINRTDALIQKFCGRDIEEAFKDGAEYALQRQWTRVDECSPQPDTVCLACGWEDLDFSGRMTRYTMMAWYDGEDFYDAYNERKYHPVLWLAIPSPKFNPEKEER